MIGIRTSLPLPSIWEIVAQLMVYFLVEDYTNYWIHRFMHCKWGYEKIHKVHHEYAAPIGFAAPYAHWAEILILGIPSFLGPAMVPGHIITFWLWIGLRQIEAIETHSGWNATATNGPMFAKVVPSIHRTMIYAFDCAFEISFSSFIAPTTGILVEKTYGHDAKSVHLNGSPREAYALSRGLFAMMYSSHVHPCDHHDYHHYVGGLSHSNFASVFTYCDYIYGTDKGYRYQKKVLQQAEEKLDRLLPLTPFSSPDWKYMSWRVAKTRMNMNMRGPSLICGSGKNGRG
nr:methylsterol monooxygenase 1-1-like [Ipomoea batatas]